MCSSGTPHPAIPPRPGPRLTAPPHPHHPAPPPLSLPITPRQPRVPSPTSPHPSPPRPAPLRRNSGVANVSDQQYRRRNSTPRHRQASNSSKCPPDAAQPRPAQSVPAGQDKPAPHGAAAAPAIRLPRGSHHTRSAPPTLPSPLPHARTVGLKDPTKTECPQVTKFSPPIIRP